METVNDKAVVFLPWNTIEPEAQQQILNTASMPFVFKHVAVMPAVVLTHDDRIGDGVTFGAGVRVAGGVTIEDAAYLGSGALLRENLTVGSGAVVGMGAVVTRSIPAGEVWAGVPARRLRGVSVLEAA